MCSIDILVIFGFVVQKGISDEISGVNNTKTILAIATI